MTESTRLSARPDDRPLDTRRAHPTQPHAGWMALDAAAQLLDFSTAGLRDLCRRAAARAGSGARVEIAPGVTALKIGRVWRVRVAQEAA